MYEAMKNAGPLKPAQLAQKTNTYVRYIQEWLNNQAAGGYIMYDPETQTYELPEEHSLVITEKDSPFLLGPAYYAINSLWKDKDKLAAAIKYFPPG